jgi:hypothetical protein
MKNYSGRYDPNRVTKPNEFFETMQSDIVPIEQWHPDDVSEILKSLKNMGEGSVVRSRPDGSLAVFGAEIVF